MKPPKMKNFILEWMTIRKFNMVSLAKKAKITRMTLQRAIEGEKNYISTLEAIAGALGIPYEDLWKDPLAPLHEIKQVSSLPDNTIVHWLGEENPMLDAFTPASKEFRDAIRAVVNLHIKQYGGKKPRN